MITIRIALSLFALVVAGSLLKGDDAKKSSEMIVTGYLPDYRVAQWSPKDIGPITDLVYFGVSAPETSSIPSDLVPKETLRKLAEAKAKNRCRLWLCIGGWEKSKGFLSLTSDPKVRQQFSKYLVAYAMKNGFDGLDFDWEHPQGADQMQNYIDLLRDVREAGKKTSKSTGKEDLLIGIAIAGWMDMGEAGYAAVDRVHLMAYDQPFPHANMEQTQADVKRVIANGCPAAKIILGVPFYGRNDKGEAKSFAELSKESPAQVNEDLIGGFALNGRETMRKKIDYVRLEKLGGIMIWEIAQDSTGKDSLLRVIAEGVRK